MSNTQNVTRAGDAVRQWIVVVSLVAAVVGSFIGSGALGGTPITEAAGGALSSDATPIAPAGPAFSIWSVIYLGLAAYTAWQVLPSHRHDARQRRLGYPMVASLLLNAAWILSVQAGWLVASVVVIVALLAVLGYAFRLCMMTRPSSAIEAIVVDGVVGLYLGWVTIASAANITAALKSGGFEGWGLGADVWAVIVLAVAGAVGVAVAVAGRGRLAPTASLCWGLAWVGVARLSGEPHSVAAAVTASVAVAVVIIVTILYRVRTPRRTGQG
jgi:hypothetical protein